MIADEVMETASATLFLKRLQQTIAGISDYFYSALDSMINLIEEELCEL